MIANRVDDFFVAIDTLQQANGAARFDEKFRQTHRDAWIFLRRLKDTGITGRNRHAKHPHRDHSREVKGRNARNNAKRLTHRIDINFWACAISVLTLLSVRNTASKFNNVHAAHNVTAAIGDDLTVLR